MIEKIIVSFFVVWVILGGNALFMRGVNEANVLFSECGGLKLTFHAFCFLAFGPFSFLKKVRAKICYKCFG